MNPKSPFIVLKISSVAIISLTLYYVWHVCSKFKFFKKRNLKTPPIKFLSGNLHEFIKDNKQAEVIQNWTKIYGITYGYYEGSNPILVTSDLDLIQEVFIKQYANFSAKKQKCLDRSENDSMINLIQATKSRWKRMRNIINPTFSQAKLRDLNPKMVECINENILKSNLNDLTNENFNVSTFLKKVAADIVWKCALNTEPSTFGTLKVEQFTKNVALSFKNFKHYTTLMYMATYFSEFRPLIVSIHLIYNWIMYKILKNENRTDAVFWLNEKAIDIVHNRRKNNIQKNDYLQLLINAESDNSFKDDKFNENLDFSELRIEKKLTTDEIKVNLSLFIMAGYETTSSALGIIFYLLAKYPHEQQNVYEEIKDNFPNIENTSSGFDNLEKLEYMNMFIKEALRMYPIATGAINRRCVKHTNINGIDMPKNLIVVVDVLTIHNDGDIWGPFDTKEFHPERFSKEYKRHPASYFGFGLGPRNCVGIKFAYTEMKLVMVSILSLFEVIGSDHNLDQLEFIDGAAVRSLKNDVFITLKKRN